MRVLVACEFSGVVRDAFRERGHDAWSCDLLPSERPGPHIRGDAFDVIDDGWNWELLIAHPPCTHLAVSGARWFKDKKAEQASALNFVHALMEAPAPRIAIENPISIISSRIRKPDQIIQPWQFGHGEVKATCLWLKNLPPLKPTNIVEGRSARVHREPPGPDRWKNRSRTLTGIAAAMADQWGTGMSVAAVVLAPLGRFTPKAIPIEVSHEHLFWAHVFKTESCWYWRGPSSPFSCIFFIGKSNYPAHRVAWQLVNGVGSLRRQITRTCPTETCVNPAHFKERPRQESKRKASARIRNLYFLQMGDGPIKIGIAANVDHRIASAQTYSPYEIRLLGLARGTSADEVALHRRFAAFRLRGEWFTPAPEILQFISTLKRPE